MGQREVEVADREDHDGAEAHGVVTERRDGDAEHEVQADVEERRAHPSLRGQLDGLDRPGAERGQSAAESRDQDEEDVVRDVADDGEQHPSQRRAEGVDDEHGVGKRRPSRKGERDAVARECTEPTGDEHRDDDAGAHSSTRSGWRGARWPTRRPRAAAAKPRTREASRYTPASHHIPSVVSLRSEPMRAEKVVNDPSSPVPSPAFAQFGVPGRVHTLETSAPSAKAPTTLTSRVLSGRSDAPCGRRRSTGRRSPVPSMPPTTTATASRQPTAAPDATTSTPSESSEPEPSGSSE